MVVNWYFVTNRRDDWPCGYSVGEFLLRTGGLCDKCGWSYQSHVTRPANEPHHPNRRYLCDDPDCCDDGCPVLICAVDGEDWPCTTKQEHVRARKAVS